MNDLTPRQIAAIRAVCDAIVDAVKAAGPMGAPGGIIYAALMAHGVDLAQYEQFMAALVRAGKLTKSGHLYRVA
jgi:hypothetical protein